MNIEEVKKIVKEQPRLLHIIHCLYENKNYKLSDLKKLDSENIKIAFHIIYNIYPENPFFEK